MTHHIKATSQRTRYGMRVTIEDGAYLVTVSSSNAALAWSEAWKRYDFVSASREKVSA